MTRIICDTFKEKSPIANSKKYYREQGLVPPKSKRWTKAEKLGWALDYAKSIATDKPLSDEDFKTFLRSLETVPGIC